MSESAPEKKPNESYEFLKKPIPANEDGVSCIIIHEKAQTELGRLLNILANVPFNIYSVPNPDTDSGTWETFHQATIYAGGTHQATWVNDYFFPRRETHLQAKDKNDLMTWMNWKIQQNWYLLELLVREKLPIVFVYQYHDVDEQGNKIYIPMPSFEFLQHSIRNLKNTTRRKWDNEKGKHEKREQKRILKGKPPVAHQRPHRNKDEGSKP